MMYFETASGLRRCWGGWVTRENRSHTQHDKKPSHTDTDEHTHTNTRTQNDQRRRRNDSLIVEVVVGWVISLFRAISHVYTIKCIYKEPLTLTRVFLWRRHSNT